MIRPLLFKEIFKSKLWGGNGINRLKGTALPGDIGESLEISTLPGDETLIAEGEWKGLPFRRALERMGPQIMGHRNFEKFGTDFPLLVKFIFSAKDLSVQVHPDDNIAREMGHPYGKDEMWYIVSATPGANVKAGFATDFSDERYMAGLADGSLADHINVADTHSGDCFFIPAGCIHSISAGNLLIEIQQSSDDTFRVYDFDRVDANGQKRELHVEQARRALHYGAMPTQRVPYRPADNRPVVLVDTAKFTTSLCRFTTPGRLNYSQLDSFVIFVVFEGEACFTDAAGYTVRVPAGRTVLFPAENDRVDMCPAGNAPCSFLETYIR